MLSTDIPAPPIQPSKPYVRTTAIRLTPADQEVVDRIKELKGSDNLTGIIRFALRRFLWELEAMARGESPRGGTPPPRPRVPFPTPTLPTETRNENISAHERERRARVVSFWQQRATGQRTEKDVVVFYGEMEREFPHLLSRQGDDPYLNLVRDLTGQVEA